MEETQVVQSLKQKDGYFSRHVLLILEPCDEAGPVFPTITPVLNKKDYFQLIRSPIANSSVVSKPVTAHRWIPGEKMTPKQSAQSS